MVDELVLLVAVVVGCLAFVCPFVGFAEEDDDALDVFVVFVANERRICVLLLRK